MKILYADQDAVLRNLVQEIFSQQGHNVALAIDAGQFLAMAARGKFDLFMVAYHLPDQLGTDALQALMDQGITTPAMVFTGYLADVPQGSWHIVNKILDSQELIDQLLTETPNPTRLPHPV